MDEGKGCLAEHDPVGFRELKAKIMAERGLDIRYYKDNYLSRRFAVRMRAKKCETLREYVKKLDRDPGEWYLLLDKLTINVTEFCRNPKMWAVFVSHVLPKVFRHEDLTTMRRFWSAGCASGEEPYTIALFVREYLKKRKLDTHVVVRGSDLDENSLRKARRGVYNAEALRKMEPPLRDRYFSYDVEFDQYRVGPELRQMVRFNKYDLTTQKKFKHFDVITCRNVVIYFDRRQQETLFRTFYDALNKNGFLIIGKTETLVGGAKDMFRPVDSSERIYQKR